MKLASVLKGEYLCFGQQIQSCKTCSWHESLEHKLSIQVWLYLPKERNRWIHVTDKYSCGTNNKSFVAWKTYRKMTTSNFVIFIHPFLDELNNFYTQYHTTKNLAWEFNVRSIYTVRIQVLHTNNNVTVYRVSQNSFCKLWRCAWKINPIKVLANTKTLSPRQRVSESPIKILIFSFSSNISERLFSKPH